MALFWAASFASSIFLLMTIFSESGEYDFSNTYTPAVFTVFFVVVNGVSLFSDAIDDAFRL